MRIGIAVRLLTLVPVFACAPAATGDGFADFWQEFGQAVAHDSEPAVRALTRFPFLFDGREHDASDFGIVYAALFDDATRACLPAASPVGEDAQYLVFCGTTIFVFGRDASGWRFMEFGADPEA